MSATMVHYAYTNNGTLPQELIINGLPPVLHARAVLEQVMYAEYIRRSVRNITACIEEYLNHVDKMVRALPKQRTDLTGPESSLYHTCVNAITRFPNMEASIYDTLLSIPSDSNYWTPSIPREFYLPFLATIGCGRPDTITAPVMLLPRLEIYERPLINNDLVPRQGLRISFDKVVLTSFTAEHSATEFANTEHFLATYLSNFHFMDWSIDHFIAVFASFCIEPGVHAMRAPKDYTRGIADICYEIVHPYRPIGLPTHPKIQHGDVYGSDRIIELFKFLTSNNRVAPPADNKLFSEFLGKCNCYVQEVIDYFAKPLDEITALESMAFQNSIFSQFIPDRFEAEDSPTSETQDEATAEAPADNPPEDITPSTDSPSDESSNNEDEESKEKKSPPKRDPAQMLIDLASSEEKLSDYLYRRLVVKRMTALVQNPPSSIPSSEILLMRRYLTLWVHLLSVASIKDYISRLSFKLMDDAPIRGSAYLK